MTSNDLFIIEVFNNRMNTLEEKIISLQQEMKQNFDSVNKRIDNLQTEIKVNSIKIEGVHNSVNWGFAGMTIAITAVIAIVGLVAALAPTIKEFFTSKQKKYTTSEEVKNIVETAITNALAGKLR